MARAKFLFSRFPRETDRRHTHALLVFLLTEQFCCIREMSRDFAVGGNKQTNFLKPQADDGTMGGKKVQNLSFFLHLETGGGTKNRGRREDENELKRW